jgi:hypothetical protein
LICQEDLLRAKRWADERAARSYCFTVLVVIHGRKISFGISGMSSNKAEETERAAIVVAKSRQH